MKRFPPPELSASSLAIDLTYSGSLLYVHTKAIEAIKWLETLRKITIGIFKVAQIADDLTIAYYLQANHIPRVCVLNSYSVTKPTP